MLIQLAAATSEPVSVAEAKAHLRQTQSSDDVLIGRQITAAREFIERFTGRALAAATYRYTAPDFLLGYPVQLPLWPISAVSSVSYLDSEDARIVVDAGDYLFDADRSTIAPGAYWPAPAYSVNIAFATAPAFIPEGLKSAILARVQAEYEAQPEEAEKLRAASESLAWPFRMGLGA